MLYQVVCPSCGCRADVNRPNQPGPPKATASPGVVLIGATVGRFLLGPLGALLGARVVHSTSMKHSVETTKTACHRCKQPIIVKFSSDGRVEVTSG